MTLPHFDALQSARLVVRGITDADLGDLHEVSGDPEVTRFLPYPTWQTAADGQAWLQRMRGIEADGSGQQLVVVGLQAQKVIGTVLLFRHEPASARVELGYALGRRHWRSGLMREALQAVCAQLFDSLAIRRIEAQVNPDNLASNALLQKLGFIREGTLRKRWVSKGIAADTHFYGLLADDRLRPQINACAMPTIAAPEITSPDGRPAG